jgi:lauroyl/myristoyl acyltransferase
LRGGYLSKGWHVKQVATDAVATAGAAAADPAAGAGVRDIRLTYRRSDIVVRPLAESSDVTRVLWIIACAMVITFTPARWHPSLCRLLARAPSRRKSRGIAAARTVGGLAPDEAITTGRELHARRLLVDLHATRGLLWRRPIDVRVCGREHLDKAVTHAKGAILWVADFVEAGDATKIAFADLGNRLSHLSRPEHGFSKSRFGIACLNWVRQRYENRFLHRRIVFDRRSPQVAKDEMLQLLAENRIVSIMASAHELADAGFLQGRLRLALGALNLSRRAGCPVLPVFVLPAADHGGLDVIVEPALVTGNDNDRAEFVVSGVADFVGRLEARVRQQPTAWTGWYRSNVTAADPA